MVEKRRLNYLGHQFSVVDYNVRKAPDDEFIVMF
jgi:hypothetical protein